MVPRPDSGSCGSLITVEPGDSHLSSMALSLLLCDMEDNSTDLRAVCELQNGMDHPCSVETAVTTAADVEEGSPHARHQLI